MVKGIFKDKDLIPRLPPLAGGILAYPTPSRGGTVSIHTCVVSTDNNFVAKIYVIHYFRAIVCRTKLGGAPTIWGFSFYCSSSPTILCFVCKITTPII